MNNHFKLLWLGLLFAALMLPTAVAKTPAVTSLYADIPRNELYSVLDDSGFRLEVTGNQHVVGDDRLLYTVSFENTGFLASGNIDIVSPVPEQTVYISDSARGENCDILFSADGGANWGQAGQLKVQMQNGGWRTATARDYTHIRWVYRPQLRPAEMQQVSFQVVME